MEGVIKGIKKLLVPTSNKWQRPNSNLSTVDTNIKITLQCPGQHRDCHDGKMDGRMLKEYLHVLGSYNNSTEETETTRGEMNYRGWQSTYYVSSTVLSCQNSSAVKKESTEERHSMVEVPEFKLSHLRFRTYTLNLETVVSELSGASHQQTQVLLKA